MRLFPRTWCALAASALAFAQIPEPGPHHLFHPARPLTAPSSQPAREVAKSFLASVAPQYGLSAADLDTLVVIKEYQTSFNGVTHLIYKQRLQDRTVYNAEYTVNVDRDGQVLNAGGSLFSIRSVGQ